MALIHMHGAMHLFPGLLIRQELGILFRELLLVQQEFNGLKIMVDGKQEVVVTHQSLGISFILIGGNNGGYDHVGIVTSASNGRVHTIEGNAKNAVKIDGGYSNGYAINSTDILGYGHPNYSSPPPPTPVNNPIGNIDTASGGNGTMHFTGWAFDADNSNASLEIHIYVGGPAGSGSVQAVQGFTANLASDDVNRAYGISGNHRFDATLEVPSLVGTHMVYVYAINIGSGNHTVLFADNITVTGHNPLANYEAVEAQPGKVHVVGWTSD